jgi:23S rRNA (guanine745-N1)-methyltransferase
LTITTTALACPVCGEELVLDRAAAACRNGHAFDRARNGYLNLLLSNQKQSKEPGDSAAMMQSRRAFLHGGFYDPMADACIATVAEALSGRTSPRLADIGCGEGFFTARLHRALGATESPRSTYGVDISRPGIKMAAASHRGIDWVVASLHRSPFLSRSLDVVLIMFAPIDAADVRRVVRDDGMLVTVTPGPDHLDALRAVIYSSVKPHPKTPALMEGDTLFDRIASTRIRYPIVVDTRDQIVNLLAMTPYYWNISQATSARVEALSRLELTVDASITVFRPRP